MPRGYSANRSSSARPTLKSKRRRSVSLQQLRSSLASSSPSGARNQDEGSKKPATTDDARKPIRRVIRKIGMVDVQPAGKATEAALASGTSDGAKSARSASQVSKPDSFLVTPANVFTAQKLAKAHIANEDAEASEDESESVLRQDVLTKYKSGGKLVDQVLDEVVAKCVAGAGTYALCRFGDDEMHRAVTRVFGKARGDGGAKLPRGRAYPCCVSVNHVLCNHSPSSEADQVVLTAGDVVKVHLGCHIDGYPVSAARTVVVAGLDVGAGQVSVANAMEASRVAMLAMLHLLRPGAENGDITDHIAHIGHVFETEAVEGVLSTRTKRWIIDCLDAIITRRVCKEDPQQDVAPVAIGPHQVWTLDVAFTNSPSYRMQASASTANIFRKNEFDNVQDLRSTAAPEFLHEITSTFHCFPFHVLHASQPSRARLALAVLKKAGLVDTFHELQSKPKFVTTRFSCTVAVTDKRVIPLCGLPQAAPLCHGDAQPNAIPPDVAAMLNDPLDYASRDAATTGKAKKRSRVEKAPAPANEDES